MPGKTVEITGLKQSVSALRDLGQKITDRVIKSAMNAAATPVIREARKRAKKILRDAERKGYKRKKGLHLYQALGKKVKTYKKNHVIYVAAGPLHKQGGYHGHLVEFGHRISRRKLERADSKIVRTLQGPQGRTEEKPFMKPAWDAAKSNTLSVIESKTSERLEKEAEKIARGNGVMP